MAEHGAKTISAARGRVRLEVTSQLSSSTPTRLRSAVGFFVYVSPLKSCSTSRFSCKKPFENDLGGILPHRKFFFDESPKRHFLVASSVVPVSSIEIDRRFLEESREK
jgi:hypothetical protein